MKLAPFRERNYGLDLIRGLAAVGIAAYHFLSWNYAITLHSLGTFGVYVFFILSAVTMMARYEVDFRDGILREALVEFYRNRVARLFPLLAIVSILSAHWAVGQGDNWTHQAARTLLTGTGAMGLHLPGFLSNATGAWSLGIEAVFYVVFPIVALFSSSARIGHCIVAVLTLLVFQQAVLLLISDFPDQQFWHFYITPVTFAPFFALGILVYKLPLPVQGGNIWIALLAMGVLTTYTVFIPVTVWHSPTHFLTLTVISAAAVGFAYRGTVPARITRVASFLGDISYALYLSHWFAHRIASTLVHGLGAPAMLLPVIYATSALLIAWLSFRFFELPARNFLRSKRNGSPVLRASI